MALRTLDEVTTALASVQEAILKAQKAQSYQTGFGQQKSMALLDTFYRREKELLIERQQLTTGGASSGLLVVNSISKRMY